MTMTHRAGYLGVLATDRQVTLNVMDFCRLRDGQIIENWVMLDCVGRLAQAGLDVIARWAAMDSHFA